MSEWLNSITHAISKIIVKSVVDSLGKLLLFSMVIFLLSAIFVKETWVLKHDQLVALNCVKNWFHYIKSSYILISDLPTANAVDDELRNIFRDGNYLIVAIDLKNSQGWLPSKAWKWIENQSEL